MIIEVKVIAGASKISVNKLERGKYKVKLTAAAEKGRANQQLKEILAEYFGIASGKVEIFKGFGKPNKLIKIAEK